MPLRAWQSLSSCEVLGPLGAGAMGKACRARDPRFEREAQTLDSRSHPDVAGIHGIGRGGAARFLALELIRGEDAAAKLAHGSLPVAEALDPLP